MELHEAGLRQFPEKQLKQAESFFEILRSRPLLFLNSWGDQPVLRFFDIGGIERVSIAFRSQEASVDLSRADGSEIALSPSDDGPGFHLFNLKSRGQGQGVFMSMLTADDLTIYQSGLGSVAIGRVGSEIGLKVSDSSDRVIGQVPR